MGLRRHKSSKTSSRSLITEMKYLVSLIPWIQHHDRGTVVLVDHPPQVDHCVWQRHLRHYECISSTITLCDKSTDNL